VASLDITDRIKAMFAPRAPAAPPQPPGSSTAPGSTPPPPGVRDGR
jgi:hypothetical protein